MIKQFLPLFLLALLLTQTGQGQKLKRYDDILLFKEAKTKLPIIVVNDSLAYKNGNPFPFHHTPYPDKLSEYMPFEIGTKTYLVHQGCGPVLEFRNDSVVRIDHSFLQKNQYRSVPFTYNNEIYLFSGYGLFTYKNIITHYNFKSGEWTQIQTKGDTLPEPRYNAFSYMDADNLFIFGGYTVDEKNIPECKNVKPELWRLHLPTMTWSYINDYDADLFKTVHNKVQINNKLYTLSGHLTELDFTSKTVKKYDFKSYEVLLNQYVIGDSIFGIFSNQNLIYFKKTTISELKGNSRGTFPFISQDTFSANFNYIAILVLTIVLLLSFILYKKRINPFSKSFNGIVFNGQKGEYTYKRKTITHFEENEKKVLRFLLNHIDQFVSLNQLNELFENPAQPETQSAIFKRREQAINGLLTKVSKLTGVPEEELLLERKNIEDKRLKDVLLLPQLLKIV